MNNEDIQLQITSLQNQINNLSSLAPKQYSNTIIQNKETVVQRGGIQSAEFSTGATGWRFDADGNLEANAGHFRGDVTGASGIFSGVLTGGSLNIPDITSAPSFHVDNTGNIWSGAAAIASAPFKVTNAGALTATGVTVTGALTTSAGSSINGSYLTLASVTGAAIAAATITASNITNATITATQIATGTITSNEIANATITGADIAAATITGSNIGATTITAANITAATITGTQIASATITGSNIAATTITASNITNATITATQIANATITTTQISGTAAITGTQIASATITGSNIALVTVAAGNIISGTITATQIASATITGGNIVNGTITTSQISATAGIVGGQIASASITGGNIAGTTITGANITNLTITAGQIANLTITSGKVNTALMSYSHNIVFSFTGDTQVNWASGTLTTSDGTAYTISAGNTGVMSAKNYIYLDTAVSVTVLQKTTTFSTAVGNGKMLIAVAQNNTTEAVFQVFNGIGGTNLAGGSIVAGSITANEIAATTITASQIAANTITAAQIAANTITATQIAANTITAAQIASNTITVTQLAFTPPQVFTVTPTTPYNVGDLWTDGSFLKKCATQRLTGAYNVADWVLATNYTDNTVANSKVTTFYQTSIPTSVSAGDFWIDSDDNNKLYRATAVGDTTIAVGHWILIPDNSRIEVAGAAADINANTTTISGGKITAGSITATQMTVSQLSAISADMGAITAGTITLNSAGFIRGGQTDFDTGIGYFLGLSGGDYKLSIGNPAGDYMNWDGTHLILHGSFNVGNSGLINNASYTVSTLPVSPTVVGFNPASSYE
jgi:uncharacterized protein YjbI with pentapeptide repeats